MADQTNDVTSQEVNTSSESAEEATSGATSADEGATNSNETPTSEEKPLILGRFRSYEEMESSYRNLEGAFTRSQQENATLRRNVPQVNQADEDERLAAAIKAKGATAALRDLAREVIAPVAQTAKAVRFESEYNRLMENRDFRELEPVMSRLAQEYGDMIKDNNMADDPRLLHILYKAAKGEVQERRVREAEGQGKVRGEISANKKVRAQVEGSSSSRGTSKKPFDYSLSKEEMKKRLQAGEI